MPIKALNELEQKRRSAELYCNTHGDNCEKYPAPWSRGVDGEEIAFAQMVRRGRLGSGKRERPTIPPTCRTRKLTAEEIGQRLEYVKASRDAWRKGKPKPPVPETKLNPELLRLIAEGRARQARGELPWIQGPNTPITKEASDG